MKKPLILYQSKAGASKQYAEWLGEELSVAAIPLHNYKSGMEQDFDCIVCCGGVYGSEIDGLKQYKKIAKKADCQTIYLAIGVREADDYVTDLLLRYNFRAPHPPLFYCRGGLDPDKLDQRDKATLTALKAMIKRKRNTTERDLSFLKLLNQAGDYRDKAQLQTLISYLS